MRKRIRETVDIERSYIEAHVLAVVAVGLDYGFDISIERYSLCTVISLRQHYIKSPRMTEGVDITFYYDPKKSVYIERVTMRRGGSKMISSDCAVYEDFIQEALAHLMRLVWDIETE